MRSPKCSIGSAPGCTLRIASPWVGPLHCVLARGADATRIRRWSPDTLLNGRPFEEATLQIGDRLTIGRLELEYIDSGVATPDARELPAPRPACPSVEATTPSQGGPLEQHLTDQLAAIWQQLAQLAPSPRAAEPIVTPDLDRRQAELERQSQEIAARRTELERQCQEIAARQGEAEAALEAARTALDHDRQQWRLEAEQVQSEADAQLDQARAALDEDRRQWQAERDKGHRESAVRSEELRQRLEMSAAERQAWESEQQQRQSDLDKARAALDEEHRQWQSRREEDQRASGDQSEELRQRLEAFAAERQAWESEQRRLQEELDTARAALDEERRQWQSRREEDQRASGDQSEELRQRLEAFAAERQAWESEQQQRQSDLDKARAALEEDQLASEARSEELRRRLEVFAAERQAWESEQRRRQEELDKARAALNQERRQWQAEREEGHGESDVESAALHQRCEAFETERQAWEARHAEEARGVMQKTGELTALRGELETQRQRLLEQSEHLNLLRRQFEEERQQWQQDRQAGPAEVGPASQPDESAARAEPRPKEDLRSIFQRLGVSIPEDEDAPKEPARPEPPRPARPQQPASRPAEDDNHEASVADYMARLLERVGGSGSSPASKPADEPGRAASSQNVEEPQPVSPDRASQEMLTEPPTPHAVAPERSVDLSAMRALANFSAQTAIDRHTAGKRTAVQRASLLITVMASLATGGLLWNWLQVNDQAVLICAEVTLAVAAIWGLRYLASTGYGLAAWLLHRRRLQRIESLAASAADESSEN